MDGMKSGLYLQFARMLCYVRRVHAMCINNLSCGEHLLNYVEAHHSTNVKPICDSLALKKTGCNFVLFEKQEFSMSHRRQLSGLIGVPSMSLCSLPSTCMPEITAEPGRNATIPVCLSIFYTVFPKDKNLSTLGRKQPVSLKLISTNLSCPNPPTLNPDPRICRWEYVGSCRAMQFHIGPNLLPSQ